MNQIVRHFFCFGAPIATDSILSERIPPQKNAFQVGQWSQSQDFKVLKLPLLESDKVYGFGQSLGGFNKRGQSIVSYCTDDPVHTEEKKSLYGAHNFFVVTSTECFMGVFVDASCRVTYDLGLKKRNQLTINLADPDYRLLILEAPTLKTLMDEWFEWIGKPYLPPIWGLGYIQSRWGYKSAQDIRDVLEQFEAHRIPLDGICLDIDYMERYKDFTVDPETFPDFENLCTETREKGVHLLPIIDAGVKIEAGYEVYEQGVEKGYFCTNAEGFPFVGAVWPGLVHFPDFLNEDARIWFGSHYKQLMDVGIDGFWNDMNEPAIFFTPERLKEVKELFQKAEPDALDVMPFFELLDGARTLINNDGYQRDFFHQIGGRKVVHERVHNQYGYRMTQSAHGAFRALSSERKVLFSRASLIGAHRHGGLWMGDNASWWSHLKLNMTMLVGMNLCGFLYIGADTGGFSHDVEPELLIRWHQLSMFTPLLRNHSALGTQPQEPYVFEKWALDALRASIQWRYRMIFWQFSNLLKATLQKDLLFKPLEWVFEGAEPTDTQVIYADALMLAPVLDRNQSSRIVSIPEKMLMLKLDAEGNFEGSFIEAGLHRIPVALHEQIVYLKKNKFLVLNDAMKHVCELDKTHLTCVGFVEGEGTLDLFDADQTYGYEDGDFESVHFTIKNVEADYHITQKGSIEDLKRIDWVFFKHNEITVQKRMEVDEYEDA